MRTSNVIKLPFSVAQMSFNMQNESIRISNVTSNESTHSCTKITWTHTHTRTHTHTILPRIVPPSAIVASFAIIFGFVRVLYRGTSIKLFFFWTMLKVTTSIEIEACKSFIRKMKNKCFFFIYRLQFHQSLGYYIIQLKNINLNVIIIFLLEFIFYPL